MNEHPNNTSGYIPQGRGGTPGPDNFEFSLVGDLEGKLPFLGYDSTLDCTNKPPNVMDRGSQNVFLSPRGNIATRPGRLLYDAKDTTASAVKAGFAWNNSKGASIPVRITANGNFSFLSNISGALVWYNLLTGLTKYRGVFDTMWDNTDLKDKLLFVVGNNNLYDWAGGTALFVSAVANTTITLDRDPVVAGFASTGSVNINGTTYAYTGTSTVNKQLTGVTGDASTQAVNSVVFSTVNTTASGSLTGGPGLTYNFDFIKVISGQLWLGSYTSQTVYYSKSASGGASNFKNFSAGSPPAVGDGGFIVLDSPANGIATRQGNSYISAGSSDWYIISFSQFTTSTGTIVQQVNTQKQESSVGAAAYAHEFIDVVNDTVVYLSKDQQLREFGTFRNLQEPAYPMLSEEISTELAGVDFSGGQLKAVSETDRGTTIYIISPNSGTAYLYQIVLSLDAVGNVRARRFWQPPFVWGISRVDAIGNTVYGFSNSNPQMYQLWDTNQWHDDSPSGNVGYVCILVMPYRSFGRRQGRFKFDKVFWDGYMSQGTSLYGIIYYDYQGSTGIANPIIHSVQYNSPANDQSFMTGVVPPSLGDASLGSNPLGDITAVVGLGNTALTDHDLLPKFKIITGLQPKDCFEFALACYSVDIDSRWEINMLGANPSLSSMQAVSIIKRKK